MRDFYHELSFHDHIDLENKSINNVFVVLSVLLSLYLIAWGLGFSNGGPSLLILFFLFVFFLLYQDKVKLKKTGNPSEQWKISVVGSEFSWISPKQINEKSFSVDVSQIAQIQKKTEGTSIKIYALRKKVYTETRDWERLECKINTG